MKKYIYLLIGESGSGKSTIANALHENYGLKQLWSYTTRPPRYENEPGHVFVPYRDLKQMDSCVAYTEFDGYEYWATQEQVEASDVYVVDPDGLLYFMLRYHGDKIPVVFFIDTSISTRKKRMKQRGDSKEQIKERIKHDRIAFKGFRDSFKLVDDAEYFRVDVPNDDGNGLEMVIGTINWLNEEEDINAYFL